MRRNSIIFGVLCVLLVISMVKSDVTASAKSAPAVPVAKAEVFVSYDSGDYFYKAWIYNDDDKIQIKTLNQKVSTFNLIFGKSNQIVFIDAAQNYIIVKEVSSTNQILSYWVIKIVYDYTMQIFYLDSFSVNPRVSSAFHYITSDFEITKILEIDVNKGWICVSDESNSYFDVYKINIHEKLNTLIYVAWFEKLGANVIGGNSRVLYDEANDQFLVDPQNLRDPLKATNYTKVPVCSLTHLPLYSNGSTQIIDEVGWSFQYLSESQCKTEATTFLYRGYGDQKIKGAVNLVSSRPINYIWDNQNFFIAITDCDVYVSDVYWSAGLGYKYFAGLLSSKLSGAEKIAVYNNWSNITVVVFIQRKFYFLSGGKFYVYGDNSSAFNLIYQVSSTCTTGDQYTRLFSEIQKYRSTLL